jgi:hypothetical protein
MSPRSITRTVTTTITKTVGEIARDAWMTYAEPDMPNDSPVWEIAAEAVAVAVEQDIATRLAQALGVPAADIDSLLATAEKQAKELTDAAMAKMAKLPRPKPAPVEPPPSVPTAPPFEPKQPDPSDIPWERLRPYLPTEPGQPYFIPPASPVPYVPTRTVPNSAPRWWGVDIVCKTDDLSRAISASRTMATATANDLVQRIVTTKAPPYDDSHPTFIPSDS